MVVNADNGESNLTTAPTVWRQQPRHQRDNRNRYNREYYRSSVQQQSKKPLIGNGSFAHLKSANHKTNTHQQDGYRREQGPNRTITGVFISRLHKRTSPENIAKHIRQEINMTVNPEKLQTKFDTYSSFYIRCQSATQRRTLMDTNLWPNGSLIKPFYS